jgi:hypothetical protein
VAPGSFDPAADLAPIRALLDKGCHLEADVVPIVARGLPELPRPLNRRLLQQYRPCADIRGLGSTTPVALLIYPSLDSTRPRIGRVKSRMCEMKRSTTGLSVRFFSVTTATGQGRSGRR